MKRPTDLLSAGVLVLATSATASAAAGEGWNLFRGDPQLTGTASGELPRKLTPRWTFRADEGIESTAAIHDGVVYVASLGGVLHALDLRSGKEIWRHETGAEIKSSPSWWNDRIFFGDESGVFRSLDAVTGAERWTFETDAGVISSANFAGGRVLFGSYDGFLYCLKASDGSLAWKVETAGYVHATPAIVELEGEALAVSTGCDGYLRLVRVSDGGEVRRVEMGGYVAASPAVRGRFAYVGTFENQVLGIDLQAGAIRWSYEDPDRQFPFYASAAVEEDLLVVGGRDKQVHGLRPATGEVAWKHAARSRFDASPVILGGRVFVATTAGQLLALDRETGAPGWRFETGSSFIASPSIAEGMLVIGDADGTVYAFGGGRPAGAAQGTP